MVIIAFHSFIFLFLSCPKTAFNPIALAITDDSCESLTWNFQYSPNYKQFEWFAQLPCIRAPDTVLICISFHKLIDNSSQMNSSVVSAD